MDPDNNRKNYQEISLQDLSSPELLGLWKQGDEQAARILSDRYSLRMVAFIAGRLNRRFRDTVDPEEIVQSALGSFFYAAQRSKLQVSQNVSFWNLLAAFAKRKMMRRIERLSTEKRGGDFQRTDLPNDLIADTESTTEDLLDAIRGEIREQYGAVAFGELNVVVDRLVAGQTHHDIAVVLGISERTVRRRITQIRELLSTKNAKKPDTNLLAQTRQPNLPRIDYREFVLGKMIGAGGFGKVYRARLQSDASLVAVKFLRKGFWKNEEAQACFLREIDLAAQVKHPGVIDYFGWGQSPHGGPYVVSQWIEAVTLTERRDVSPRQFVDFLLQICDALKSIHEHSLVHGDLTPSNILVSAANQITITDFGFSQSTTSRESREDKTPPGGTLGFAAPEQISSSFGKIGPATDIYAVGGLAYWFLFGRAPHQHNTAQDSIASTLSDTVNQSNRPTAQADFGDDRWANAIERVATMTLQQSVAKRPQRIEQIIGSMRRLYI